MIHFSLTMDPLSPTAVLTVAWLSEILEIFYVCDEKAKGLDHVTQHEPGSWHWRDRKEDERDGALYRPVQCLQSTQAAPAWSRLSLPDDELS